MALLLRQTIFLSSVLLNAETWINLTKTNISDLETLDETLLRRLLDAPSKTPIPSLYLELGIYPIEFIIKEKRLMFLHQILNCGENRLINQFFWAQEQNPVKNDWSLQIREDLKSLDLNYLSLKNIQLMKKEQFRALVKVKCKQMAFKALMAEKEQKSKLTNIQYSVLKVQDYFMSSQINLRRKKLLFKIRTRMIATSDNFGQKVPCKSCHLEDDTIGHVIN